MFSGIRAQDGMFLSALGHITDRISKTNQQLTSGTRVATAADDPSAVMPILEFQSQIDRLTQANTDLQGANTEVTTADAALQSAGTIMDQLVSIASQGMNSYATADDRTNLSLQVQQLENQLVSVANTSIGNNFVFGGNNPSVVPYSFNWAQPSGAVNHLTNPSPTYIQDGNGSVTVRALTATQIFDLQDANGNPVSGNIFQAAHDLGQALAANDTIAIQAALGSVKAASGHLQQVSTAYGNTESWIKQAIDNASSRLGTLRQSLSAAQDIDMPTAITQLTSDQTALQVSLSAHASLSSKTLFDYLG